MSEYTSLDGLAADFPVGLRFRYSIEGPSGKSITGLAQVEGVVWGLPLEPGGPDEPAIVIQTRTGIGQVYPHEVTRKEE